MIHVAAVSHAFTSSVAALQITHACDIFGACILCGWSVRATSIFHPAEIREVFLLSGVTADGENRQPSSFSQLRDSPPGAGFFLTHWRLYAPSPSFQHPLCDLRPFFRPLFHCSTSSVAPSWHPCRLRRRHIFLRLCDVCVRRFRLFTEPQDCSAPF